MRHLTALFAFCCRVAFSQSLSASPSVTVLLTGDTSSAAVLQALQDSAGSALAPSGLRVGWADGHLPKGAVDGRLLLVRLQGRCNVGWPVRDYRFGGRTGVLGRTYMSDGKVLPIADVLCDSVRRYIAPALRIAPPGNRELLFGRALGRVAVHELYHILLQTSEHARSGLARAEQSRAELLAPEASFTPREEQQLAASIGSDSSPGDSGGR
jgi:hypothetical protein